MVFVLLILAAFAAGVINSIAGGGSFLTFPSLLMAGIPSVSANASSTVALLPGSVASGWSYRREIAELKEANLKIWVLASIFGGATGALLLLATPDKTFRHVTPWLLLASTLLFAFGNTVSRALRSRVRFGPGTMLAALVPISIYGGYFGGGIGIMFLAAFRLYGMEDVHAMNGLKAILASVLNALAAGIFIFAHHVAWKPTLMMVVAGTLGGYVGPMLARKIPPQVIRQIVIVVGVAMTTYFFWTELS